MTFTQTLYANEATQADTCNTQCQLELKLAYDDKTGCRIPSCQSLLTLVDGGPTTSVVLHQTFASDATSFSPQRLRRFKEEYCIRTGCRAPFCQARLDITTGNSVRVMLDIPDVPAGSTASNTSSTAASVTAAARALAARPVAELSAMMNETVVSTSSPVVRQVRRFDVRVVLSIPDANSNANATVAAITASANALTDHPVAIAALPNATVFSTSPVVVAHAVVPLVVPAAQEGLQPGDIPMDVVLTALLVAAMMLALACVRLWRWYGCKDVARKQLLAEARARREERERETSAEDHGHHAPPLTHPARSWRGRQNAARQQLLQEEASARREKPVDEVELTAGTPTADAHGHLSGTPYPSAEQPPRALAELTKERVRLEREQVVRSAGSSSYTPEAREDV